LNNEEKADFPEICHLPQAVIHHQLEEEGVWVEIVKIGVKEMLSEPANEEDS